jgi:prolipoprotein diacylglyceryltransferase
LVPAAQCATALPNGAIFRLFIAFYCLFRLLIEFLKPREVILGGLCPIQWASAAGALAAVISLWRMVSPRNTVSAPLASEAIP